MNQFLDYEIILLLAKHGERPVLNALAKRLGISPQRLYDQLNEITKLQINKAKPRKQPNISRVVDYIAEKHPDKASNLRLLLEQFQDKTFLPELRDIKRFFERHGRPLDGIKSRAEAGPRLFELLATLETRDLEGLYEGANKKGPSSLGLISDQIMRRSG